jgi:nicotinamidase/pyrazinamidase
MKTLILIDIQNDFIPGGALPVSEGDKIIPIVNELQKEFDLVIATQDWHPPHHKSFASSHPGKNVFEKIDLNGLDQVLWPDHCVQGSPGAEFHPMLNTQKVEAIFRKGTDLNIDSYSGLFDNGHRKSTGLAGYLRERKVGDVYVCGLAADYCVYFTAKDLLSEGFQTYFIEDATRAISDEGFMHAKNDLIKVNARFILSSAIRQ